MKSLGFTLATAEGRFLSRCEIKKELEGITLDVDFEKDIKNCISIKKLKGITAAKNILQAAHPDIGLWIIEFFKNQGQIYLKFTTAEIPPYFSTQHARFSGLYSA